MTNIEKHEKAIQILENIDRLDYRIESNVDRATDTSFWIRYHYIKRIMIDTAIKKKLTNYYNKNFKL